MNLYIKEIEQTYTGMVVARVIDSDKDLCVGLEFFKWPPFNQEKRLKRAHAWADKWIENCEKYCIDLPKASPSENPRC